MFIETAIQTIL